jgi:hypothetical protein
MFEKAKNWWNEIEQKEKKTKYSNRLTFATFLLILGAICVVGTVVVGIFAPRTGFFRIIWNVLAFLSLGFVFGSNFILIFLVGKKSPKED